MNQRKENSTYSINEKIIHEECDLIYALDRLGGRWKLYILSKLHDRVMRYKELKEEIHPITERMLTLQLKSLEADKLVKRTVFPEIPPRVEYELTEFAAEMVPIWNSLIDWGMRHKNLKNSQESDK